MKPDSLRRSIAGLVIAAGLAMAANAAEPVSLTVRTDRPSHPISPSLYGIFFEDINYGADGGLSGELVQNRSFEFQGADSLFAWSKVERDGGTGSIDLGIAEPIHPNNPHYLRLQIDSPGKGVGVANSGFGGIVAKQGERYYFTAHIRGEAGYHGGLTVRIERADGWLLGECRTAGAKSSWTKVSGTIRARSGDTHARLVVLGTAAGRLDLDMVSLYPEHTWKKRPNGLRADLVQKLADLKPAFMRFPGGCIVEGKSFADSYRWKETIGDPATRKQNWNRWQSAMKEAPAPQYYQTYALGFHEFFQLCEDIGAEPLPILNCGMSCQFQDKELAPAGQLDGYIQDMLDLIEYANGPITSKWGAKRAAAGHPAPFNLKLLGVGNEQWGNDYFDRYRLFHAALKSRYPQVKLVTSAGPGPDDQWFDLAWRRLKTQPADIVDEHYYRPPTWFLENSHRYDNYDRNGPTVFAGKYASHTAGWGGASRNNLAAAVSEAAFMTGLERNSDVVVMASYAPLFAKIGFVQWVVNLIWFDNNAVYGTPSYYVQQLFSRNKGDVVLPVELRGLPAQASPKTEALYATASGETKTGQIILKAVNPTAEAITAQLHFDGLHQPATRALATTLTSAQPTDENSIATPTKVAPVTTTVDGPSPAMSYTFPPWSVTVLRIEGTRPLK